MKVSFEGINENVVTFYAAENVTPGNPVKFVENGKVGACADSDPFIGVAVNVTEDSFASVLMREYVTLTYSGTTAPGFGRTKFLADNAGGIKVSTSGNEYIVVEKIRRQKLSDFSFNKGGKQNGLSLQ